MKKIILTVVLMAACMGVCACIADSADKKSEIRQYRDSVELNVAKADTVAIDTKSEEYVVTHDLFSMIIHSDLFPVLPYKKAKIAIKKTPTVSEMNEVIRWAMLADCFYDTIGETDEFIFWWELNYED